MTITTMADFYQSGQFSDNNSQIMDGPVDDLINDEANVLVLEDDDQISELMDPEGEGQSLFPNQDAEPEIEEQELSPDGILDEETVGNGLSNLGRSADGTIQVLLHLNIPGMSLQDISILAEYTHLQKVELPYNQITDLSPLSNMPYLLELDVSNNQIETLLDFTPPKNLKCADFSYNNLMEITDLSAHHYLQTLKLDHNQITEIKGIENCSRLGHLSLGHNQVQTIEGLDNLPIKTLNLAYNKLTKIEGIQSLLYLQNIDLSGNKIRSMNGLENHDFLEAVDLEDNEVIDLAEVDHIRYLPLLRDLNLQRNPIRELPDYRLSILFNIPNLVDLDRHRVNVDEKVAARNMFNPPLEVIAARDHIMHVVYSFLQPSRIYDSTLPSVETPYPMLVLVGPTGAGKKDLAIKLVDEFPDYFGYGPMTTTMKPQPGDNPAHYNYITLDEFENDIKMGKFILTYAHQGELFGLQQEAIEAVAREGLACIVHMELEGVLTLKNTHFEPRYVLIMPMDRSVHDRRLREREMFTESQLEATLDRGQLYASYNRDHPGFFDMMICSDDIAEAYRRLRRLVMDYLGISGATPSVSEFDTANTDLDRENTADTMASGFMRQWSRPSLADNLSAAIANVKTKMAAASPMHSAGRGIVEAESMKRRASAAREAVSGQVPTVYEMLLGKETPRTVPTSVNGQVGLGDAPPYGNYRSAYSAPTGNTDNMDVLPPNSPDSSDAAGNDDDSLSNISEAREVIDSPYATPRGPITEGVNLPPETLDRLELRSGSDKAMTPPTGSAGPMTPRPPDSRAGSRAGSAMSQRSNRPGSERHPVLPPIGTNSPQLVNPLPEY